MKTAAVLLFVAFVSVMLASGTDSSSLPRVFFVWAFVACCVAALIRVHSTVNTGADR